MEEELKNAILFLHEENKINYLRFMQVFFMLVLIEGLILNIAVISLNDGRMPVKTNIYINDSEHFNYTNNEDVKLFQLSDIIGYSNKEKGVIFLFSIGDLLLLSAVIFLMGIVILEILKEKKLKKIKSQISFLN